MIEADAAVVGVDEQLVAGANVLARAETPTKRRLREGSEAAALIGRDDDGRAWSEFSLSGAYEGPPGWVHGGISALVLDHILGEAASDGLTLPKFTGTITLKYLRGTPLGPLRAEAWIDRVDGFKTYARGALSDAEGVTVEAEGGFIQPAWARDAG